VADHNPEREAGKESDREMSRAKKQLSRAAKIYLHELSNTGDDGVKMSTFYAEYLASYMLWLSSEKLEKLTRRLNALTVTLIALTAMLIVLTVLTLL
jgi:hypothetical protein